MSFDKYERGCQHFNSGHQRITYKTIIILIITLRLTHINQWIGVDHAARIHLLKSHPMSSSVEKNKMIVMATMTEKKWFLTCMSNASLKCRSLRRKKNYEGSHTPHTNTQTKIIAMWTIKNEMK